MRRWAPSPLRAWARMRVRSTEQQWVAGSTRLWCEQAVDSALKVLLQFVLIGRCVLCPAPLVVLCGVHAVAGCIHVVFGTAAA